MKYFWPWALFIILVHIFYLVSFPLFIEGDGVNYYKMIHRFDSSLIHAPGYPFIMMLFILPLKMLSGLIGDYGIDLFLRIIQVTIFLSSIFFFIMSFQKTFPRQLIFFSGTIFAVDYCMMTSTTYTRPEFMQASLVLFLLGLIGRYISSSEIKSSWPILFGAFSGLLFITKFNGLFFFIPSVLLVYLLAKDSSKKTLKTIVISAGSLAGFILLFLLLFHQPKTGTFSFTLEKGWIYLKKLKAASITLNTDGLSTQKYLFAAHKLPDPRIEVYNLFSKIDPIPKEQRYDENSKFALSLIEKNNQEVLASHLPLPQDSSKYHSIFYLIKLYDYLGLKRTEKIAQGVFLEAIGKDFPKYINHAIQQFVRSSFSFHELHIPYGTAFLSPLSFLPNLKTSNEKMLIRHESEFIKTEELAKVYGDVKLYRGTRKIRINSLRWLQLLSYPSLFLFRADIFWGLSAICLFLFPFFTKTQRRESRTLYLLLFYGIIQIFGISLFTGIFYFFREKEFMFMYPLIVFCEVIALTIIYKFIKTIRLKV